jgi:hypothetical protein
VDRAADEVPTDLVDLTVVSFRQLRVFDRRLLEPSLERVRAQVRRRKANMSEAGPPGRAD